MATVMVVDDTAIIRETVAKILRGAGFDTVCASNGCEAMAALEISVPDVLLLDIMMPVMDGLHFLEAIRGNPGLKDLPVIVMSALQDDETQFRAHQLGAARFLVKAGFSVNQMLELIREQVNRPN